MHNYVDDGLNLFRIIGDHDAVGCEEEEEFKHKAELL